MMSNIDKVDPKKSCSRRTNDARKVFLISGCFHNYNLHKGGFDLADRFSADYEVFISGKSGIGQFSLPV